MRKKFFLVLDCETCTLDFVGNWKLNEKQKRTIATARPLIYDIGWTICDRMGTIQEEKNFLISETFSVPSVFQTAYYKEKRPLYLKDLKEGKTELKSWNEVSEILFQDLQKVDMCMAYNAMFDFKKAIPFTELYIKHLYSEDFQEWYARQKQLCKNIALNSLHNHPKNFDANNFRFKGQDFPLADLWGEAVQKLLNTKKYRKYCLKNGYVSASGRFFTTNAEVAFRYLMNENDFIEDHTALSDARIETKILGKCSTRGKIEQGIVFFPFRILNETCYFIKEEKNPDKMGMELLLEKMIEYAQSLPPDSINAKSTASRIQFIKMRMQE